MLQKIDGIIPSQQQEIYLLLLRKYEKSLFSLGVNEEEVANELGEFIQYYELFK